MLMLCYDGSHKQALNNLLIKAHRIFCGSLLVHSLSHFRSVSFASVTFHLSVSAVSGFVELCYSHHTPFLMKLHVQVSGGYGPC